MKLIIDVPEEKYEWICQNNPKATEDMIVGMITHGTPIPDNATNGDVIKALFPTADISLNDSCFEGVVNKYGFDMKWWNAPYQKGGKE